MGVSALIIDAHNSTVLKNELTEEDVDNLFKAAEDAIKTAKRVPQQTFTINLSRVIPVEWGIKEGMGPCGIASLLIKLNDGRSYGYILMDSNNMISGFNEKILDNINDLMEDAVVLTSDTHMVNALGATTQGYSPFGEKMELEKIVEYVRTALLKAIKGVKSCRARYTNSLILNVNVLGDQGLEILARTLEDGFKLFTRTAYKIIPLSLIISLATIFLG
jgi:putative membrane protein